MQQRLKLYLKEARVDAGESLHSLRAGCAITLALAGFPLADVMGDVGWKADHTASVKTYQDLNLLKNFVCAFPPFSDRRSPQPS